MGRVSEKPGFPLELSQFSKKAFQVQFQSQGRNMGVLRRVRQHFTAPDLDMWHRSRSFPVNEKTKAGINRTQVTAPARICP
jgi:hypothetical protein